MFIRLRTETKGRLRSALRTAAAVKCQSRRPTSHMLGTVHIIPKYRSDAL